jgi:hypothetical protein
MFLEQIFKDDDFCLILGTGGRFGLWLVRLVDPANLAPLLPSFISIFFALAGTEHCPVPAFHTGFIHGAQ